tara:strand:- start:523 stop:1569 length:1047 start_codon:yes stop_codon:yes gene_type:complete
LLAVSTSAVAQTDPSQLLDEALLKTREMAFRSDQVDWPLLEAEVRHAAADANDVVDLLGAFEILVEGLGDGHSFVNVSAADRTEFRSRFGHDFDAQRPHKSVTSTFRSRREPEARQVALRGTATARLVTVPMKQGGGPEATAYANALFANIAEGAEGSCGYIVDLRGNQGGNVWPMVAGLSPLLGEGWRSFELGADGDTTSAGYLSGGAAIAGEGEYEGQTIVQVDGWRSFPRLAQVPVAVLIDDAVGSSGEGVAVAFKGRAKTRFFGEKTYGAASSNEGFIIGDRVNIVITTGMMADRHGRIYPDGVSPDTAVAMGPGSSADPDDAVVEAAKAWLGRKGACRHKTSH